MTTSRLAVIGAGPKAAALAAKAQLINEHHHYQNVEVVLFEKGRIASNWNGGSYTDGEQDLCTPATRDLGFPYDATFGPDVQKAMQERYSWMSYRVEENRYSEWINRGLERASHGDFAKYISDSIRSSGATCHHSTTVTAVRARKKKWTVECVDQFGKPEIYEEFDGLVVTGPGPARKIDPTFKHPALFDGEDVWTRLDDLKRILAETDDEIAIIGGGGTAAAIAAWMIRNSVTKPISFISEQPTFYTRHGDYFENRVFDDEDMWLLLNEQQRRDFVRRTTRAVVWAAVSEQLAAVNNLRLLPGRVQGLAASPYPGLIDVSYAPSNSKETLTGLDCGVVIDASGFDTWWFRSLLPNQYRNRAEKYFEKRAAAMTKDLDLSLPGLPPLHVPMASWAQGPGFSSLMVLGRMADRILSRYVSTT